MATYSNGTENIADQEKLERVRHSLAHVLAQAVLAIRPGSKLGFGPSIDDGFYYDFILSSPLTEADFPEIDKKMKEILKQGQTFTREDLSKDDALARIEKMGEPYKREYAKELCEKQGLTSLSFYTNGTFLDMCEGPHVGSTKELPYDGFKLRSIAGAYWRGDSKNVMMTRIYAWAFLTKAELQARAREFEEGLKRDHKKLGKELHLFTIDDDIGKGLPLWMPNGTVLRDELEKLMKELEFKAGYHRVSTPHLAKADLYYKTGHLPYYAVHMYPFMEVKETVEGEGGEAKSVRESYVLKPMNCPHHHKIFAAQMRSYRDLPLRLAEYGDCYRYEDSGSLSGLLRVRAMSMNDAHIYCTAEQIKEEFRAVLAMHHEAYKILGLKNYYFRFSTSDAEDPKGKEKFVDDPEAWAWTENIVREILVSEGHPFKEVKGEAAFYGPKIDVQFKTVTGREETASTTQLDFAVPKRLGLVYKGADNLDHHPYVIHRAPLGTHERFAAFLIEHYGGAFPTWLAPTQVRVVTVSDKFNAYGEGIVKSLRIEDAVRADFDYAPDTMGKKIRNAVKEKIPNVIVIGEREELDGTVTLRRYGLEEQRTMPFLEFRAWIKGQIDQRLQTLE